MSHLTPSPQLTIINYWRTSSDWRRECVTTPQVFYHLPETICQTVKEFVRSEYPKSLKCGFLNGFCLLLCTGKFLNMCLQVVIEISIIEVWSLMYKYDELILFLVCQRYVCLPFLECLKYITLTSTCVSSQTRSFPW